MNSALWISLEVLALDVPLLFILGGSLGWLLAKRRFRGRNALSLFLQLPIVLPPSVLGLYLLMGIGSIPLLRGMNLLFSFPATVIGGLVPALPIMIQSARAAFSGVDDSVEEAALTLGSGPLRTFFRITLPLARRPLLVGLALSSARALGDFGVTLMIAGNMPGRTQTLPLYIYSRVEAIDFRGANIAAGVLLVVGITSLWLVQHLETGRNEQLV